MFRWVTKRPVRLATFGKLLQRNYIDLEYLQTKYFDLTEPKFSNLTFHTSSSLSQLKQPPNNSICSSIHFIEDSLYNPNYGYFSKQARIYNPTQPIDITKCRDGIQFLNLVSKQYDGLLQDLSETNDISRQVWHTPTELFNPHYGFALANYIVQDFVQTEEEPGPLVIYEMGGGNGTTMNNVLDYIKVNHPTIYRKTRYCIVEISQQLHWRQKNSLLLNDGLKHPNVQFINQSMFDFDQVVLDRCYFLALEVIDNFSHDVLRLDRNQVPYQGMVLTDKNNQFHEVYQPVQDPALLDYLDFLNQTQLLKFMFDPTKENGLWKYLQRHLPFQTNFQPKVYLPTRTFQLLNLLFQRFPNHKLVLSDFYKLPQTIRDGKFSPVVQTRYLDQMVPCDTYLVKPGYFDIFFPTQFELLKLTYDQLKAKYTHHHLCRESKVLSNNQFLRTYADLEKTKTQSGENLLLEYYSNNKFFLT